MTKRKSIFLCALLATVAFMPIKGNVALADERAKVTVDVIEESNNLFDETLLWEPGKTDFSLLNISNKLDKDIRIKAISFDSEEIYDYLNLSQLTDADERYDHFLENSHIIIKNEHGDDLYESTLKEIFSNRSINLEKEIVVDANSEKLLHLEIKVLEGMDNKGQGLHHKFNLAINYEYKKGESDLPNTGGFSNTGIMLIGILGLGLGAKVLKLPQNKEDI